MNDIQTQRRRMAGIPPLPKPETPSPVSAAAAPVDSAAPAETSVAPQTPAPAPQAPAPAPVASIPDPVSLGRRRMTGPSNAPLLLRQAAPSAPVAPQTATPDAAAPATEKPSGRRRLEGKPAAAPAPKVEAVDPASLGRRRMAGIPPLYIEAPVEEAPLEDVQAQPAAEGIVEQPIQSEPVAQEASNADVAPSPVESEPVAEKEPMKPLTKKILIGLGIVAAAVVLVLLARVLRFSPGMEEFIAEYDGHSTQLAAAPEGIPAWLGWQHFFNMFFMVLIVRTGLQIRYERRPEGYWTPKKGSFFSPGKQSPKKVSITQWLHQALDVLWVVNGILFIVLLFATGHWMRIVPTDVDILPNMFSALVQYVSLDWPTENGWVHYNALQVMAYFTTVFIAAPLAIFSGFRMSTWWPANNEKLSNAYPVEVARAIHVPVMIYFVAFTVVHVFLVFFTGALRNLNHMYTSRDVVDFWGLVIFAISVAVIVGGWFLTSNLFMRPVAGLMGKVSKN